jgi:hypothetical protein
MPSRAGRAQTDGRFAPAPWAIITLRGMHRYGISEGVPRDTPAVFLSKGSTA